MNGWLIYDSEGLSRNEWFIDKLIGAAERNGARLGLIEAEKLVYGTESSGDFFFSYCGSSVPAPDFALVRTIDPFLSQILETAGVRVFNSARVSSVCNDKRKTHALCASLGIPCAKTYFADKLSFNASSYPYPLVIKSANGHGGREVSLARNPVDAQNAVNGYRSNGLLLQEMQTPGKDVRVYILSGKILCAVKRTSAVDFRSNFSLGGSAELFDPTPEMIKAANALVGALSPTFIGIDFVFGKNGEALLNEAEDVVGSRMLYSLTDLEIHELFIRAVLSSAK